MRHDTIWQTTHTTRTYLNGVRGAIPLAHEQIDVMLRLVRAACGNEGVTAVSTNYHSRPDKLANILAPVETQCTWLRDIGFAHVDIYLKIFELALFGGLKQDAEG